MIITLRFLSMQAYENSKAKTACCLYAFEHRFRSCLLESNLVLNKIESI